MPDEKGQGVGGWSESVPHSVWLSRVNFKAQFPAQVKSRVAIAFGQQQQQQWQEQQVNAFKSYVCFALLSFFLSFVTRFFMLHQVLSFPLLSAAPFRRQTSQFLGLSMARKRMSHHHL